MAEGLYSKEIPKFKNPEEELYFLRRQIAEKEQQLEQPPTYLDREKITKDILVEYSAVKPEEILEKKQIIKFSETDEIVLRLSPETHDEKMEEMLGILLEKGIKNSLAILEQLNNPHLNDDFHRFLIQYLNSVGKIPGVKEETPLFKVLHMKLFEITLPPAVDEGDKSKGFKEFIGAMEQFYAGMQSISLDKNNEKEIYFTLEVALGNESDEVVVYAGIPDKHLTLFEKQILAFYHNAKVREVADDYNIFAEGGESVGAYASLAERGVMPIKTYKNNQQ